MVEPKTIAFDALDFLAKAGVGRRIVQLNSGEAFFSQGQPADTIFYLQSGRSMRTQADLVDQLFNSSERRLARILLLMAEYGLPGEPEPLIPQITQETLAEMIGTTRSRVNFFMNRFRKLGLIEYNGRIRVHKSLLNLVLQDKLPEQNAVKPPIEDLPHRHSISRHV